MVNGMNFDIKDERRHEVHPGTIDISDEDTKFILFSPLCGNHLEEFNCHG